MIFGCGEKIAGLRKVGGIYCRMVKNTASTAPSSSSGNWRSSYLMYQTTCSQSSPHIPVSSKIPSNLQPLVPLLNKCGAASLWIFFGLGAGRIRRKNSSSTNLDERGYFQIHPSEAGDQGFDHDRIKTDKDYSVQVGVNWWITMQRERLHWLTSIVSRKAAFVWGLTKLQHWIPSSPSTILK